MKLLTTQETKDLEEQAIKSGMSEQGLIEEAGLAVAQEAWMLLGTCLLYTSPSPRDS